MADNEGRLKEVSSLSREHALVIGHTGLNHEVRSKLVEREGKYKEFDVGG